MGVSDSLSIYISIYLLGKLSHVLCRFYHTLNSVSQFYNMALRLKLVAQTDNWGEPPSWVWRYIWVLWIFCWIMSGWYSTFRIQDVRLLCPRNRIGCFPGVFFHFLLIHLGISAQRPIWMRGTFIIIDFHGYWAFLVDTTRKKMFLRIWDLSGGSTSINYFNYFTLLRQDLTV